MRASSDTSLGVFTLNRLSIYISAAKWRGPLRRPAPPADVTHKWVSTCEHAVHGLINGALGPGGGPPAADLTAFRLILNRNAEEFKSLERCYNGLFKNSPAVCLCLFLPLVNLSEGNVSPLSHSRKYEWKGINKSKLLAGLSCTGLGQFTFLLYGFFFGNLQTGKCLFRRLSRAADHMTHSRLGHVGDL